MPRLYSILVVASLAYATAFAQADNTFKIGVILPMTGALAEYGVAAKNGIELARKEHPAAFSKIAFLYDDSQYDGKKTLSAYQKFKAAGDVSLYYVWGYGPIQALIPIAEADRSALLAITSERPAVANRKYAVRFCYDIERVAEVLLDYLRSKKLKKFAVVKAELAFINALVVGMQRRLRAGESIDIVDTYEPGDMDFKTSLAKLRKRSFDALGVFLISGQVSQFYRQSKQLGIQAQTFGPDFLDSMQEVRDARGSMTGAVIASGIISPEFASRYSSAYGNDLQLTWAANGYEFAMLAAQLFGGATKKLSADEVVSTLRSARPQSAGAAEYEFHDSEGSAGFDFKVGMRRIEKDRIVDIAE